MAASMAVLSAAAMALMVVAVLVTGRGIMEIGMSRRADAVARSVAAAMPTSSAPIDLDRWAARVREATPDAISVVVRDAAGRIRASASLPPTDAGVIAATAELSADAAVPAGSLQISLDQGALASLLERAVAVAVAVALLLVAGTGLASWLVARRMTRPVREVAEAAARMASGDLEASVAVRGDDEIGVIAAHVDALGRGLRRMVGELREVAGSVGRATAAIGETSRSQVTAASGQTAALDRTSSTVAEVAQASRLATESAQLVIEVAERSEKLWRQGEGAVREGMAGLGSLEERVGAIAGAVVELSERTVRIGGIIATMRDLAEQSNVLALNAAIEASKVGEAGRGFAVVAGEMRRLAEQSRRATDEVRVMLGELQRATRRVVTATGDGSARARAAVAGATQASATISGLATAIEESSRAARGIAETTRRQTEEMEAISAAVDWLHGNMGETLAGAHRIEEVAQELEVASDRLSRAVSAYRT
jgi:methyl-accepting chemotaxis protein